MELLLVIVTQVAVSPDQRLGQFLGDPCWWGVEVLGVLQDITSDTEWLRGQANIPLLAVLAVDVGESSLLWLPLHSVAPAGHQAVHHVQRVVGDAFQHKPEHSVKSNWNDKLSLLFHLPSELSRRQGGSHPAYFCSSACLSPRSNPEMTMMSDL